MSEPDKFTTAYDCNVYVDAHVSSKCHKFKGTAYRHLGSVDDVSGSVK